MISMSYAAPDILGDGNRLSDCAQICHGAGGGTRTPTVLSVQRIFVPATAFAAARLKRTFVVWTIPSPCLCRGLGAARLVSTPSWAGAQAWLGIATELEVSPNLSSSTPPVSRWALNDLSPMRLPFRHTRTPRDPTTAAPARQGPYTDGAGPGAAHYGFADVSSVSLAFRRCAWRMPAGRLSFRTLTAAVSITFLMWRA